MPVSGVADGISSGHQCCTLGATQPGFPPISPSTAAALAQSAPSLALCFAGCVCFAMSVPPIPLTPGLQWPVLTPQQELQRSKKNCPMQGRIWEARWEGDAEESSLGELWCGAQCCWHCLGVAVLQGTPEPRDVSAAFVLLEIITKSVKLGTDHGVNNRANVRDE